jgi:hypothetical protein
MDMTSAGKAGQGRAQHVSRDRLRVPRAVDHDEARGVGLCQRQKPGAHGRLHGQPHVFKALFAALSGDRARQARCRVDVDQQGQVGVRADHQIVQPVHR